MSATPEAAWDVAAAVVDPEIPVLTIADLGVLRRVNIAGDDIEVVVTPTYSGCPAMDQIRADIAQAFEEAGMGAPRIVTQLAPAWTTDWMTTAGRQALHDFGIAPPRSSDTDPVHCPQCRSGASRVVSEFGSTACKALMVCGSCGEPFDHFKELK